MVTRKHATLISFVGILLVLLNLTACSSDPDAPSTYSYNGVSDIVLYVENYTAETKFELVGTRNSGLEVEWRYQGMEYFQLDPRGASLIMHSFEQGLGSNDGTINERTSQATIIGNRLTTLMEKTSPIAECEFGEIGNAAEMPGPFGLWNFSPAPYEFLDGKLPDLQHVAGNQHIAGIESRHYRGENISFMDGNVVNAVADVWVSKDDGYVTKIEMTGDVVSEGFLPVNGTISVYYVVISVNDNTQLPVPSPCP